MACYCMLRCVAGLIGVVSGWILGTITFVTWLSFSGGYLEFTTVVKILLSCVSACLSVSLIWTAFVVISAFARFLVAAVTVSSGILLGFVKYLW